MLKQRLRIFKPLFLCADFILSFSASLSSSWLYFYVLAADKRAHVVPDTDGIFAPASFFPEEWGFFVTYAYFALLFSLSQVIIFLRLDTYHIDCYNNSLREFIEITRAVLLNLFIVMALLFFYRGASFSRFVIMFTIPLTVLFVSIGHRVLWMLVVTTYKKKRNLKSILLMGTGSLAEQLFQNFEKHHAFGYKVVACLGMGKKPGKKSCLRNVYAGKLSNPLRSNFMRAIKKYNPSSVIYAMEYKRIVLEQSMRLCDREGIDFNIVPDLTEFISSHSRLESIAGLPLLVVRDTPIHLGYNQFLKRIFDFGVASGALLLLFPFLFFIGLLVKLTSRGPVFFRQERMGVNRKLFHILKFRTMKVATYKEENTLWGKKNEARITPVGNFLRKTSLDELPQLWNVWVGDMSIVGPRPERPFFVQKFKRYYEMYMRRHAVKSGITGWAQVHGLRGDTSIAKRIEADIYYIEKWSFWLDILIILQTLPALIKKPGE